uniref:EH domain-containing protein n=1 Tax=Panagrellus redivivus TaxID=6233 RepID=A0A7E4W574_PANRE
MDDSSDHPRTSDSEFSTYDDSEDGNSDDESNVSRGHDNLTDHPSGSESDDDREFDKRHGQSDTETRNLLEDADFEEDVLDLDHQAASTSVKEVPPPPVIVEVKPKPPSATSGDLDDEAYAMTTEQRAYYMSIFQHLQYLSYGEASPDGSISGADDQVVNFFMKSGLDTQSLGKIWDLADVNVDGRLNRFEFAVAMHLIVLKAKGGAPIPKRLPAFFDLRPTPPRIEEETSTDSSKPSPEDRNGLRSVTHNGRPPPTTLPPPLTSANTSSKPTSLSDDKLHSLSQRTASAFCPVTEFASDPPMCVDRIPLAVRPTASTNAPQLTGGTVSLGSQPQPFAFPSTLPKGPPPQPPPRNYQKGHTRSASLDLNARPPTDFGKISKAAGPGAFPAPPTTSSVYPPGPSGLTMAQALHNQRCLTLPAGGRPPIAAPSFNIHDPAVLSSHFQRLPIVPPPTMRKVSASTTDGVAHSKTFDSSMASSAHTVTATTTTASSSTASKPITSTSPDSIPPARPPPPALPQKPDYHSRCATLRQVNAELEAKLATLSQVRLQLRLRYEEVQGKSSGPNHLQ